MTELSSALRQDEPLNDQCLAQIFKSTAAEHLVPVAFHDPVHSLQGPEISADAIVGIMPSQDLIEAGLLVLEWQVPYSPHQVAEVGQAASKSRLPCSQPLQYAADSFVAVTGDKPVTSISGGAIC